MLVLILVSPDRARRYADLEVARSLLDQGHRRAANVLRIVPLGRDCDQGVSASEHNAPLDSADFIPSGGPLIKGKVEITSTYMNTTYSVLTGLNAVVGLFSSLAVNMPDFGRFSKNQLAGYHQFLALPIIGTLGALTPIFVTDAHSYIWGDFEWYMPDVIAKFDSRAAKFFVSASFLLATIGNQIAADTYPFANDVAGMLPKYINIFRATIIISVFCIVSTPWNIIKNASGLLSFLSGYSCLMGPLAGTMVSDYYLVKKGKLNVDQLYTDRGIYWYNRGWNWRAYVSFVVGFAPLLPGFAKSIDNTLDIGGAWKVYTFAWIFGFCLSLVTHYIICMYISPATGSLVESAVYPPQKEAIAPILEGEEPLNEETLVSKEKGVADMA